MPRAKSSPLRILQVVHGFAPDGRGGTESCVLEASLALRAAGHDVFVLAGAMEPRDPAALVASDVMGLPVTRLHRSGLFLDDWAKSYDPDAARLAAQVVRERKPDVVHVHHWIRLTRNLVETVVSCGVPAVVTLHDAMTSCPRVFRIRDEALCSRPLSAESCLDCVPRRPWMSDDEAAEEIEAYRSDFNRELDLAAAVIVPSRAHQAFLGRALDRPPEFFRVIPHGRLERERPVRGAGALRAARIRLGHWGHLEPYKGYHLLLEALHELPEDDRKRFEVICFGIASDPAYRARLDRLSEGLSVTEVGKFTPKTLGRTPFDVAVLPSIASESHSFVLDEAFELGVPAIVSDRGALAERLGDAGVTFEPGSARSLAARLRRLAREPAIIDRWAAAIPPLASMHDHASALAKVYREARGLRPKTGATDAAAAAEPRLARLARRLEARTLALDRAEGVALGRGQEIERKEADLAAFARSVADHARLLQEKDRAIAAFEQSVAEHRRAAAEREAAFAESAAAFRTELERKDDALREFEASVTEFRTELERKDDALREFEASVTALRQDVARKDEAIADFEFSVAEHRRRLDEAEKKLAETQASAASTLSARDAVIADLNASIAAHQAEIGRLAHDLAAFERSTSELRGAAERLERDLRDQLAGRVEAEQSWKRALAEHQRSIELHAAELAVRGKEARDHLRRSQELASALDRSEALRRDALAEAQLSAREAALLQARTIQADEARSAAERERDLVDQARAEERTEAASWRARAQRTESALDALRQAHETAAADLARARSELQQLAAKWAALDDDARRTAELEARAAAALMLPVEPGTGALALAADLAGAVLAQQAKLDELRASLRQADARTRTREVLRRLEEMPRRMRILFVIHDFLPYHAAGSEIYTYQLAKELSARHEVELVFCENRPDRPQYEARRGAYENLPFTEFVHHGAWPDFRSTYADSRLEDRFDEVLDRFRPDVVHVQHTKFFGVGILPRTARRGIPIVFTLHEYMLLCGRDGQMLQENLERCDVPETTKCANCLGTTLVASGVLSRGAQRVGRGLARALPGGLGEIGTRIERRAAVRHAAPVDPAARPALIEERTRVVRDAMRCVDLFLAPSEFLLRTFVASGFVTADRIVASRYGQDLSRFVESPRAPSATLRVGYLGTIAAYKGVHVLVDALNRLSAYAVEGRIHGVTDFFPDFVDALRRRITNPKVRILGRYDNKDVGRILSELDVLVVPSLWWENSPITIHEAFLAGVPVVASDRGGMAELVQDGTNGFLFKIGDDADLARVLMRFVADPGLAATLRPRRESIRDIREDALWTEGTYRRLIEARGRR